MSNAPGKLDLVIYQGIGLDETFFYLAGDDDDALLPVDLTGCTADLTARLPGDLPTDTPRLNLTTANGGIVLNEEPGSIRFNFTDSTGIWWDGVAAPYDLDLRFSPDTSRPPRRLLIGSITISKEQRP